MRTVSDRPGIELIIYAVVVILLLIFIAPLLVHLAITHNISQTPFIESYSTVASLYQGIVGTSVALAGSIVAIKLAQLGLQAVRNQEQREIVDFAQNQLDAGVGPITEVALKLTALYSDFILYHHSIKGIQKHVYEKLLKQQIDPSTVIPEMTEFRSLLADAILDLANSLEGIYKSTFSLVIWRKAVADFDKRSLLTLLGEHLQNKGYSVINAQKEPIEIANILRIKFREIKLPATVADIVTPNLSSQFLLDKIGTLPPRGIFDILELGFTVIPPDIEDANLFTKFGAAIFLDLVLCLPTSSELKKLMTRHYSNIFTLETNKKLLNIVNE